ncbi:enoyl-CoA hydratase/isomerase family protein [Lentibacillus sp. Marseille-P4043]|uniref:enoyl-CoA hydratase/isomerase family protein n=1 Tax=Lentibacillus sp. Marseille-P4043 TaxID=2040293 RepID=UPI000D0B9A0E|nr:enoyl-CoA hydratase-related protein [Lentibacillus sp. Marseille-P4043]
MGARDFQTIMYQQEDGIATIMLNRPSAFNAFTAEMNKEIIQALKVASKDDDVRCIVFTGNGKAFCVGEDLGGVDEHTNHATFLRERYHPMMKAIKNVPKPIVAAVNGTAAGAGMSLALAADFRLVQPRTKFVSAFMNIGLLPDSGFMYVLPRLIGYAKALEIAVLGKPISGEEAVKLGLATEMIDVDDWEEKVHTFATTMAGLPTKAFSLIKRYMMDGMHLPFDEALEQEAQAQRIAGMSDDHQEGLQAFKEKRSPNFTGN